MGELVSDISVSYESWKHVISFGSEARVIKPVDIFGYAAGSNAEFFATVFVKLFVYFKEIVIKPFSHSATAFLESSAFILYYIFDSFAIVISKIHKIHKIFLYCTSLSPSFSKSRFLSRTRSLFIAFELNGISG